MRNLRSITCFLLAIVLLALSGCKIQIKVPNGGRVVSTDGAYTCEAGQTCEIDVVDFFFDETFIAEPAPGFTFSHWTEQDHFLCGGETTPCRLSTTDFEGNSALQSVLESDETFFLQPRFVFNPDCPDPALVISPSPLGH